MPVPVRILLFAFGVAQFFVDPQPGLPELLFPLLLIFVTQDALTRPPHVLLLAGNAVALVTEFLVFGSVGWSLVSVYLTLTAVALYSIFERYGVYQSAKTLLIGAAVGASLTLAVLVTPLSGQAYRYGIRFTGFFKDPNVTAPTALFFAVALLAIRGRWRLAAIAPAIVFAISLSRASYLAAAVGLVYALAFRNRILAIFGAIAVLATSFFVSDIFQFFNEFFHSIGRQGFVNSYDNDRTSNWSRLLALAWQEKLPLGPGFSEANGMSVHSTYLRLLVEQGVLVLVLFLVAVWICWKSCTSIAVKTGLLCLIVNGLVIDATHWRVLFVALPLAYAWTAGVGDSARAAAVTHAGQLERSPRRSAARRPLLH